MIIIDFLYGLDLAILHWINVGWSHPALDQFWLQITHLNRQLWFQVIAAPLLVLWLLYIYRENLIRPLSALVIGVGVSDMLSYRIIKTLVQRPRPFENVQISSWLRHVGDAHGASFPSNHAVNCFAAATILAWYFPRYKKFFYIFAILVGISRVALGVHYPSDVVGGALLGVFVGFLVRIFLLSQVNWFRLPKPVSTSDENSLPWRRRIGRKSRS